MANHISVGIKTRSIVLKIETYNMLERYKAKLIGERGTPKITFDDVINHLLNTKNLKNKVKERGVM